MKELFEKRRKGKAELRVELLIGIVNGVVSGLLCGHGILFH